MMAGNITTNPQQEYLTRSSLQFSFLYLQKMSEAIYSNTIPRAVLRPAHQDRKKECVNDKRDGVCVVVLLSVLLFLSLLANAALAYLYYSNGPEQLLSCEPVTHCSYSDVDDDAQIKQSFHKDMENRSKVQHCPKKDFPAKWVQDKGRFYVFSNDTMDWDSSRERCQDLGGDLVIINSSEEQKRLANQIRIIGAQTLYWIGLTDSRNEGVWLWVDDTEDHLRQVLF
ncbi:C-type lectin domain family 4 member E-like [Rhinichthys klamathensis goyatoka]|uniref:C-type lectin domain family 4 member E-like n=1 Tax=Rhinichthys klamathensis goyatoka TaxID=3034132 RepID=UPI0024B5EC77|nr:C-type lectin domain family 4 member E-like [Rhinichthys klamathensis goyatoka]